MKFGTKFIFFKVKIKSDNIVIDLITLNWKNEIHALLHAVEEMRYNYFGLSSDKTNY